MVIRLSALLSRVFVAAALGVLGMTVVLQGAPVSPAAAAVSTVALLAWGDDSLGQLGDGVSGGSSNTPVPGLSSTRRSLPWRSPGVAVVAHPQPSQWAAYAIGSGRPSSMPGVTTPAASSGNGSTTGSDTPVVVSLPCRCDPQCYQCGSGPRHTPSAPTEISTPGVPTVYGNLGNGSNPTAVHARRGLASHRESRPRPFPRWL